ncbi:hypothetical protein [Natronospira bacteriovora]|uniref:Uncharacterized protein n=1 Tax=Natronospira bacteriovora TaxID=3069753 RepID=A0ABU0W7A7_9GAMM|nr:hypothetical protein [Natronospira sp. AB-CW4]MDQ2069911.1 hypothetical protein [Natronospira sp. AB-CW4]
MEALGWGHPVGIGIFLAGLGVFFWGIYNLSRSDRDKKNKNEE